MRRRFFRFSSAWLAGSAIPLLLLPGPLAGAAPAGAAPSQTLSLAADTTWSGEVVLTGDLLVPPGVTLTLLPGTHVRSAPRQDSSAAGVSGDRVEIVVAGRIDARGTAADSILFSSLPDTAAAPTGWNGRLCAVSFTADDGFAVARAWADTFAAHGAQLTCFIVPAWLGLEGSLTAEEVRGLHAAGHEIAAHTLTHPDLTGTGADELYRELALGRDSLEAVVGDETYRCRTMAYPFGRSDERVREMTQALGYEAARTVLPLAGDPPQEPGNSLAGIRLFSVPVAVEVNELIGPTESATRVKTRAKIAAWKAAGTWATILAHWAAGPDPAAISWVLAELQADPDVWLATFGEVARFVRTNFHADPATGRWIPGGEGRWDWEGLRVVSADPGAAPSVLDYCTFERAHVPLAVESGRVEVSHTAVRRSGRGVDVRPGASLLLDSVEIVDGMGAGLLGRGDCEVRGGSARLQAASGYFLGGHGEQVLSGTEIAGCATGISLYGSGSKRVAACTVTGNGVGLDVGDDPDVMLGGSLEAANVLWPNDRLAVAFRGLVPWAVPYNDWGTLSCDTIRSRVEGPLEWLPFTDDSRRPVYLDCALDSLIRVPEDYSTLTAALTHAGSRDSVSVGPGTYDEASGEAFPLVLRESVRLVSRAGSAATELLAPADTLAGAAAVEASGADSPGLLQGFTIRASGGVGVRVHSGSRLRLALNRIRDCRDGIVIEGATPTLVRNDVDSCSAAAVRVLAGPDGTPSLPSVGGGPGFANRLRAFGAFALVNEQTETEIEAPGNFWGSILCPEFTAGIAGRVHYFPFVDSLGICFYADCASDCATSVAGPAATTAGGGAGRRLRCFPTPARGVLRIAVEPAAGSSGEGLTLLVVDAAGRLVRRLRAGPAPSGPIELDWGTEDEAGHRVAAGIYFVLLEGEGTREATKVVVLR